MKAKTIKYKKLFNTGNFEHTEIGIEVYVYKDDNEIDVYNYAKQFVDNRDPNELKKFDSSEKNQLAIEIENERAAREEVERKAKEYQIQICNQILDNPKIHTYDKIIEAARILKDIEENDEDNLPF